MDIEKIVLKKNELEKKLEKANEKIKELEQEIDNRENALNKWEERWEEVKKTIGLIQIRKPIPFTFRRKKVRRIKWW